MFKKLKGDYFILIAILVAIILIIVCIVNKDTITAVLNNSTVINEGNTVLDNLMKGK